MTDTFVTGVVLLQGGIFVVLVAAYRRRNTPAMVNALVSFVATLIPALVEMGSRFVIGSNVVVGPELALWIAAAGLLHSFGMLGPYGSIWWWDYLTHTVSAALLAALIYASLIVIDQRAGGVALSTGGIAILTVLSTLTLGVIWELIELAARWIGDRYEIDPVLVHYGWRDTAMDLVFDGLGALAVIGLDLRIFVPIADQVPGLTRSMVLGSVLALTVIASLAALSFITGGVSRIGVK